MLALIAFSMARNQSASLQLGSEQNVRGLSGARNQASDRRMTRQEHILPRSRAPTRRPPLRSDQRGPGLRYVRAQYDTDACAGLGTAGGVCPVTLPCVQAPHESGRGPCIVQPLDGLGFNPSIVLAPTSVRRQAAAVLNLGSSVHYVATHRFETNNRRVRCANKWAKGAGALPRSKGSSHTSTQLLLLGSRFEVLHRAHIYGGHNCTAGKCTLPHSQPPPKALATLSTQAQFPTCMCAARDRACRGRAPASAG